MSASAATDTTQGAVVLLIDDEPPILQVVGTGLRARGYRVLTAATGAEGVTIARDAKPDVVVVDLGLPDIDGEEVCRMVRAESERTPIVVLSATADEPTKVRALEGGADDYITKPFGMAELQARLKVALRRTTPNPLIGLGSAPALVDGPINLGPLTIDFEAARATVSGKDIHLSPREFEMLALLARHPGKLLTSSAILDRIWGPAGSGQLHYLRVYSGRLRAKLGEAASMLVTRPGLGLQLVVPETPASETPAEV